MTRPGAATVVGGGIAGLAAAVSLLRAGWEVTVLERAAAFGEVGAGLAVTRNGMAALDAVGVGAAVRSAGHRTFAAGTQDQDGRWLLRLPGAAEPDGVNELWGVHRQRLHGALLAAAGGAALVLGAHVLTVRPGAPGGQPAAVTWRTGTREHTRTADLVVAADGIRSTVRAQLFPGSRLRYSGRTCWRAVIADAHVADGGFAAVWGPQTEFGAVRISDTEVYWYGYFRHAAASVFSDELDAATRHFSAWSPQVRRVVAATDPDELVRHDVHHLPSGLPSYVVGRVVLLGDAAHAMLPTMGQGANTSLEDGACVGRMIAEPADAGVALAGALAEFDRARRPRCQRIARYSLMAARLGPHLPDGGPRSLRDRVLPHAPARALAQAGAAVLRWSPPGGPPPEPATVP